MAMLSPATASATTTLDVFKETVSEYQSYIPPDSAYYGRVTRSPKKTAPEEKAKTCTIPKSLQSRDTAKRSSRLSKPHAGSEPRKPILPYTKPLSSLPNRGMPPKIWTDVKPDQWANMGLYLGISCRQECTSWSPVYTHRESYSRPSP